MSASAHPEETLQDYVDGRLSGTAAAQVREHLDECASCRAVRDELVLARDAVATLRVADVPMPADLLASVHRALDAEVARGPVVADTGPPAAAAARDLTAMPSDEARAKWAAIQRRRWLMVAGTAAAAALVGYLVLGNRTTPLDLPAQAARDLGAVGSRSLPLELQTNDAAALERYFADAPGGPSVRVIDLGLRGIPLEGGVRHS